MNKNLYPLLPPQLDKKWQITDILNISLHSQIYLVKNNINSSNPNGIEDKGVLKIINKTEYCKCIYKKVKSIQSPYIQNPVEIITYKHKCYIITKYQTNLTELICTNGISANDILNIASDISCSLKILHSHKILHLDCTPSNIYLNNDGSYCLGDFSSAVFLNNKKAVITTTPGYAPPELKQGVLSGCLADIYIFSCLLFTLFNNGYTTGCNNPEGNIKDNLPQELYSIILKGCSVNPDDRFSSIDEISKVLTSGTIRNAISNYSYNLYITNPEHPLYYLKTSLINNTANTIHKKQSKIHFAYTALLFITGSIFIISAYNYITINKNKPGVVSENINEIIEITEIDELDISSTNISSLPNPQSAAFSCSRLTILYAGVNKIDNIDNITYYTSLNELYLPDNLITNISPVETLQNLKILVLSYNNISDLSPVCSISSLTNLDISGNHNLHNINKLSRLHNLKTLNVTNTNITKKEIEFLNSNLPGCEIFY